MTQYTAVLAPWPHLKLPSATVEGVTAYHIDGDYIRLEINVTGLEVYNLRGYLHVSITPAYGSEQ